MKNRMLEISILCTLISLSNITYGQEVLGGQLLTGNDVRTTASADNQSVTMEATTNQGSLHGIYGGYAIGPTSGSWTTEADLDNNLTANSNTVTIAGGTVTGKAINLQAIDSNYFLKIDKGVVAGGYSNYTSNNTVNVTGGTITTDIYGGYSMVKNNKGKDHPPITNNHVTISGGKVIGGNISGAYVDSKRKNNNDNIISNNTVTIKNATIISNDEENGNIYGAWADDKNAILQGNKVHIGEGANITTGVSTSQYGMGIYGAYGQTQYTSAISNIVEITGGLIKGDVYGANANPGYNYDSEEIVGCVKDNLVNITGGTIEGDVYAAVSRNGAWMENNGITVSGNADLSKANLYGWKKQAWVSKTNNAYLYTNNYSGSINSIKQFHNVTVNNCTDVKVDKIDLFSYQEDDNYNLLPNGNLSISNSKVQISHAGYIQNFTIESSKLVADEIYKTEHFKLIDSDITIVALGDGVDKIEFVNTKANIEKLCDFDSLTITNQNATAVDLGEITGYDGGKTSTISTDSKITANSMKNLKSLDVDMTNIAWEKDGTVIDVIDEANLANTAVSVNGTLSAVAGADIKNGDSMSFIKAGTLSGITAQDITDKKVLIGFAQEAKVTLEDKENSIDFVVSGMPQANEQTSIIANSRTAAIAFANQGSDVLAEALNNVEDGKYGIKTFAVVHGNRSKYDVGNDVKINGWSVLAGVGESKQIGDNEFSWGVFYENGSGNYRTYNDFNGNNLTGYGSSVYNGGGAMTKYASESGAYVEAGIRAGTLKNSLSNAVADGFGAIGGYDVDSSYYGFLAGVGKVIELNEKENIDVYGKYFYTHHEGKDFSILGDKVEFDSAESNRLKLGVRYNKNINETFSHYYGVAWDYEFSGDSDTYAAGLAADGDSLQGSTAVMELGMKYAPEDSKWYFDLGVQGYAGKRQGFSGNVQATYNF